MPDGFGLAVWDMARKYDGQWQGGWEHGLGREAFYDGSCYAGGFQEGLRSGFGVYLHRAGTAAPGAAPRSPEPASPFAPGATSEDPPRVDMAAVSTSAFPWMAHAPFCARWGLGAYGWVYAGQFKHGGRHGV